MLVQEILDREVRVANNIASPEVDPWSMRFIVDPSITAGPIEQWRQHASYARRLMRRYEIQADYREKRRDLERRIDATLHLAETLEQCWDHAAAASLALSQAEADDAAAFNRERARQNNEPEDTPAARLSQASQQAAKWTVRATKAAGDAAWRKLRGH